MIKRLIGLLLLGLLAACTPSTLEPTTASPSDLIGGVATPTREGDTSDIEVVGDPGTGFGLGDASDEVGFVAEIEGAVIDDVVGTGSINCENDVYVIRAELTSFPQIALILPEGASPGTFNLVDNTGDGSVATATVFFEDGSVFATGIDGILIINDLATQAGQPVVGNFDFSASNGSDLISARGEFEFISSDQALYC